MDYLIKIANILYFFPTWSGLSFIPGPDPVPPEFRCRI
jgi:hypothetical protein